MKNIMAEKAAEGVDVRVMYDDLGSIGTYSVTDIVELSKKGIICIQFNPFLFSGVKVDISFSLILTILHLSKCIIDSISPIDDICEIEGSHCRFSLFIQIACIP